jgi:hypothetical protein
MMAERTPADNKRRDDNQKQHDKISNQGIDIADGKTESSLKKEIDFSVSPAFYGYYYNRSDPGYPDNPFDEVTLLDFPGPRQKYCFLTAGGGASPSAETSAEKQRAYKQQRKKDKAAVYDSFGGSFDYQVGGKIIKRSGKKKERKQYDAESYVLPVIHAGVFSLESIRSRHRCSFGFKSTSAVR